MKIYSLLLLLISNFNFFNIFDIYESCKPNSIIGLCRAHWAYAIADAVSITMCIKNQGNLTLYSP